MPMTIDGNGTITGLSAGGLPNATVTQADLASPVYAKGTPAFSAVPTGSTSVSNATFTKVTYGTEEFDTNSNYDTSLSRFTPTIAGYYQVNASFNYSGASAGGTNSLIALYKNGSWFKSGSGGNVPYYNIAALVYMNGSTDYLEIYAYQSSGSTLTIQSSSAYQFSSALVRDA
jgi:hypothetical protein